MYRTSPRPCARIHLTNAECHGAPNLTISDPKGLEDLLSGSVTDLNSMVLIEAGS